MGRWVEAECQQKFRFDLEYGIKLQNEIRGKVKRFFTPCAFYILFPTRLSPSALMRLCIS
jgi:hypothetical protein